MHENKLCLNFYTDVLNTKLSWEPIEVTNWAEHWFDIDIVAYKSKIGIFVSGILVPKMEIGQLTDINCFGFGSIPYGTNIAPATMVAGFQSADSESCTALISNIVEDRRFFRVRPMYRWTVGAAAGFSAFIPLL